MYKIYVMWNCKNGKGYVGSTNGTIEERFKDHVRKAEHNTNNKFHKAIRDSGPEAFSIAELYTAQTTDELARMESYYVHSADTAENGYNSDRGGGFKKTIYQYEIGNPEPIATYDTLEEASNSVGASRKTISNACLGSLKSAKGYLWAYLPICPEVEDKRSKMVYQYSLDGLLLATFNSAREASKQLGIGLSSITRCCRGERKQASGYKFSY